MLLWYIGVSLWFITCDAMSFCVMFLWYVSLWFYMPSASQGLQMEMSLYGKNLAHLHDYIYIVLMLKSVHCPLKIIINMNVSYLNYELISIMLLLCTNTFELCFNVNFPIAG